MIGDGANKVHPVYIDDLVDGLMACLEKPEASGRTYHLVGEAPVSFREFCAAAARAQGKKLPSMSFPRGLARATGAAMEGLRAVTRIEMPLSRERVDFMTSDRAYDGSRARQELGFRPGVGLDEGMRRAVAWYREKGWL